MFRKGIVLLVVGGIIILLTADLCQGREESTMEETVDLVGPQQEGEMSVEQTIARRRSRRSFSTKALTLEEVSQIAWAAQGITGPEERKRAAPSAGATYPLEFIIAVGKGGVDGLEAGIYRYLPGDHALERTHEEDIRPQIVRAALGQRFLGRAPVVCLIAADYSRTARRYGDRARRYVHMEVGHAGQNIYLQAESLGLGTVAVGAFDDTGIEEVFNLPDDLDALYLMPVGHYE
ncbi:MAG: SagB/ThcOx family dehydrogenase [Candidatus Brocadiia bacterium]